MKLYPRKLQSVADLRREKQMLRRQAKHSEQEGLFSFGHAADNKKEAHESSGNDLGDYISAFTNIMGARSVVDGALAALPLLLRLLPNDKVKKLVGKAAKEFAGGYLKWKALELGYRFIRRYIVSRHRKHEEEKEKQH